MSVGVVCGGWRLKLVNEERAGGKGGEKCGVTSGMCERSNAVEGEGGEELANTGAAEGVDVEEGVFVSAVKESVTHQIVLNAVEKVS